MPIPDRRLPGRVLIIETREALARHYWLILKKAGRLDPHWTTNIPAVKTTIYTSQPQIIIAGDDLEGHCGLELCELVRQFSNVPLILITSSTDTSHHIRCLNAGADDCLTLPLEPPYMLARVLALLRRSYRYSVAAKPNADTDVAAPTPSIPSAATLAKTPDAVSCAACGYQSSRSRFEMAGPIGAPECPSCKERFHEPYSIR